jgi:uncharacterized protein YxeA
MILKQATATKLAHAEIQQKNSYIHIMSSPRKITHVSFHQNAVTVPNNTTSYWALSQLTEVLYSNPDCETQYKDLPYSAKYPSH